MLYTWRKLSFRDSTVLRRSSVSPTLFRSVSTVVGRISTIVSHWSVPEFRRCHFYEVPVTVCINFVYFFVFRSRFFNFRSSFFIFYVPSFV